jgi:hypothetical protein
MSMMTIPETTVGPPFRSYSIKGSIGGLPLLPLDPTPRHIRHTIPLRQHGYPTRLNILGQTLAS